MYKWFAMCQHGARVADRQPVGDGEGARAPRVHGVAAAAHPEHAPARRARHVLPRDAPLQHVRRLVIPLTTISNVL